MKLFDHLINLYEEKEDMLYYIGRNEDYRIFKRDYDTLNKYAERGIIKYSKNFDEIKRQILKTKNDNFNGTKKYIVRNHYMFVQLKKYCDQLDLSSEFIVDSKQQQNVLKNIESSFVHCAEGCDDNRPMQFYKELVNRAYIKIFFNDRETKS